MKKELKIILIVTIGCIVMALTDGLWQPGYAMKSAVKIFFFLGLPIFFLRKEMTSKLFGLKKETLPRLLALGLGIYGFIMAALFYSWPIL
jgi:uncharacterized protein